MKQTKPAQAVELRSLSPVFGVFSRNRSSPTDIVQMSSHDLKPWDLRPLGTLVLSLFCAFIALIAARMIYVAPNLRVTLLSKGLIVVAALSTLGFVLTVLMWRRYWSEVGWDVSFWTFITGPAPPSSYAEARQAWLWGRRSIHMWFLLIVSMSLVWLVEAFAR